MKIRATFSVVLLLLIWTASTEAQLLDKSKMPTTGNAAANFAPAGWVIEEQVSGDLNGDSLPDLALKLIQEKSAESQGKRVLVVLAGGESGVLLRLAVAEKLLQCATCGGTLHKAGEAPAKVKIENGFLIVNQSNGSRRDREQTFRFKFDAKAHTFILQSRDVTFRDRTNGAGIYESTNYLTGIKTSRRLKSGEVMNQAETLRTTGTAGGNQANQAETLNEAQTRTGVGTQGGTKTNQAETLNQAETRTTKVPPKRITIEEVDWEK